IGAERHPFAIPIVRKDGTWVFDTAAGKEEIINRRVGENELGAERVCRGYVDAQNEYYSKDRNGDDVLEFAKRLASTPGKKDGLFWETKDGEVPSPLGPMVAQGRAEGYGKSVKLVANEQGSSTQQPYHGYLYKILTKQGPHAPGGTFDYVINGH